MKKSIVITGANSGIGFETALLFLSQNWIVGFLDLALEDENKVNELAERVKQRAGIELEKQAFYGRLDVCEYEDCTRALKSFLEQAGLEKFDVLFNCAGLLAVGTFPEMGLARQTKQIDVNCKGVVNMTYAALEYMHKSNTSCVVTMASLAAACGIPTHAVYSGTKAFVYNLTEALRTELHPIRVCDVSVAAVDTPMVQSQEKERYSKVMVKTLKNITPESVAKTVFRAVKKSKYYKIHFHHGSAKYSFPLARLLYICAPRMAALTIEKQAYR